MCVGWDMEKKHTIKARRMWCDKNMHCFSYTPNMCRINNSDGTFTSMDTPVAVVSIVNPDALLDSALIAYRQTAGSVRDALRAAFVDAGVLPKQRKGRK